MNPVSRFINDIDDDLVEHVKENNRDFDSERIIEGDYPEFHLDFDLKVGDKVKHEYFGKGVVKYINGTNIEVDFGSIYGVKELMLEYARLEKI